MLKPSFLSNEYMVSDEGFILSKKGYPLKPSVNHSGYYIVNLMIDGKRKAISVHTLVARAFCDGYEKGLTVNHKDGNKINNNFKNLEWISLRENQLHAINILKHDNKREKNSQARKVIAIDKSTQEVFYFDCIMNASDFISNKYLYNNDYKTLRHIESQICRVAKGYRKSYKGYFWKYND